MLMLAYCAKGPAASIAVASLLFVIITAESEKYVALVSELFQEI